MHKTFLVVTCLAITNSTCFATNNGVCSEEDCLNRFAKGTTSVDSSNENHPQITEVDQISIARVNLLKFRYRAAVLMQQLVDAANMLFKFRKQDADSQVPHAVDSGMMADEYYFPGRRSTRGHR